MDLKIKPLIEGHGDRQVKIMGEVIQIWPLHCHDFSLTCWNCILIGKLRCHPRFWFDPEKTSVEKDCPVCGIIFTAYIGELRRGRGVFCSKSCAAIAKYKVGFLSGPPYTGGMVPCAICGTLVYRTKADLEKFERFFCNRAHKGVDNGRRFGIGSPKNPLTKKESAGAIT